MQKEQANTLIDAFKDFKEEKNIDRPVMMGVLKDVFLSQIAKTYGDSNNFDVIVNVDKGTCEIYQNFEIVEEVEDPNSQMTLEQVTADSGDSDYEIGDSYSKKLPLSAFGRRGILNIRQNLQGRIMDLEKANLFKKYSEKVGELFRGEVYQTWAKEILILDEDGNELHIPKNEQIPGERFKKNDEVRAIIKSVELRNTTPYITLSRTSEDFLEKLFEQEVPEIADGLITVKKVVRVPGERSKVAVESYDDRIDPIGACIGVKGSRISGIVRELHNENIDVIQWTGNPVLMIGRALAPAKVSSVNLGQNPEDKVKVFMNPDEVSKGIGHGGVNIKLAGMLIGREIEVWREYAKGADEQEEDDVAIEDFNDVIDDWIIEKLKSIGCDTARDVLAISAEDIAKRADLEDETVAEILSIFKAEFED